MNRLNCVSAVIFFLLLQAVVNAQTTFLLKTNNGAWNDTSAWIPSGVPAAGDFAVIDRKTVRIDSSQHTIAGFSMIDGLILFLGKDPSLTITDSAVWYDGEFDGGNAAHGENKTVNSTFTIDSGAVLIIDTDSTPEAHRFYEGLNVKNKGTIRHIGSSNLGIRGLSFLYNEGLYDIGSNADFTGESFTGGTFINTGTLRKSGGDSVTQFNLWWNFHNQGGSLDVKTGTLQFANSGTFENGNYHADSGASLVIFSGTHTFKGTLSGSPAGKVGMTGTAIISTDSAKVTLNIKGTGFQWSDGTISGKGTMAVPEGALLVLNGNANNAVPVLKEQTTLLNQGTIKQMGTSSFSITGNSIVDNRSLFVVASDADFDGGTGTGGTFLNTGTLRKSGGDGVTLFNLWWNFQNQIGGIVDAVSGKLEFNSNGKFENAQGAIIQGTDTIDVPASFTNNGIVSPGESTGVLTYIGNYLPSATSVLKIELGGLMPGSGHDRLNVTGNAKLNGAIAVSLVNGFTPAVGDSFVVVTTTAAITDSFPTISPQVGMWVSVKVRQNSVVIFVDSLSSSSIQAVPGKQSVLGFGLSQNYPNPFHPSTNIRFTLPQAEFVRLEVFNARGESVGVLASKMLHAGAYNYSWSAGALANGVYTYRLTAGNRKLSRKMILSR